MPSSERLAVAVAIVLATTATARAQPQPGYAVERLSPSAPGAGWLVMDTLDMQGELGGAFAATIDYAHDPLNISSGSQQLAVVSRESMLDIGAAVTHKWWRLSVDFATPVVIKGDSGSIGGTSFVAPNVDLGANPDTFADARIGFEARLVGDATSAFRAGAGAELFVPSGHVSDYDTDGTYRAMLRGLVAGDVGRFTYAAQLGVHIRPLDDSPLPDSPRGSELVFGAAAGARVAVCSCTDVIVGPEIFGATAFHAMFAGGTTSLEALMSARMEGTARTGRQLRVKLGVGAGLATSLGTPDWRAVLGVELFGRSVAKVTRK